MNKCYKAEFKSDTGKKGVPYCEETLGKNEEREVGVGELDLF